MIAALCLALCLSTALVADGARCGPKQFEFVSIGKIADADASGKGGIYDVAQKIMIDTDRKREVIHQRITTESTHRVQVIYRDGLTKMQYISVPSEGTCVGEPDLGLPIEQFCTDDPDFTRVGSLAFGQKMADSYTATTSVSRYSFTIMRDTLTPVTTLVEQKINGRGQMIGLQNGNFTSLEGVADASMFSIPSSCMKRCTPAKYETTQLGLVAQSSSGTNGTVFNLRQRSSYDMDKKMTVTKQQVTAPGYGQDEATIYRDNAKMVQYTVKGNSCAKTSFTGPPDEIRCEGDEDTDPNLKKVDQITIAGQQADIYQYSWMTGMSTTTILRDTFEPISSVIQQTFGSFGQVISLQFGNTTLGIEDEKIFDLPASCNNK